MHLGLTVVVLSLSMTGISRAADSCQPIVTFADGKQPLREVFVSPGGNNSTGNGTQTSPYQTISRALQGVQPGDAIRLLPGNHTVGTSIGNLAGTSNAPIWLGGVPGMARPVFSGGTQAFQLSRVRYLIVENIEVSGSTANGINCDDGGDYANSNATRYVIFRNLYIHDIGTGGNNDGLKLSGVNDYFVLDCVFARMSAGGSAIDHVGCQQGLIARCSVADAGSNAIQCKGGSENIEIRWNQFTNAGGRAINIGGSTGFEFFRPPLSMTASNVEAKNIRVIANLFQGSEAPIAFVGTIDSLVANNTLISPGRWIMRILQETLSSGGYTFLPCASNQFVNNLVYYDRSQISTHVNVGANTYAASFRFSNNLWYAYNLASQSQPVLPAPEVSGIYGMNPLFVNAAGRDYSVPTNSPATAKGRRLSNVRADLLERCYANPPTIGAFEASPVPIERADSDGDLMPDIWEDANGLNKDNPNDAILDGDNDRMNNFGEYLTGTDPNDAQSVFMLRSPRLFGDGISFRYQTSTGRVYRVETREWPALGPWLELWVTNGTGMEVEFQQAPVHGDKLYRVKVQFPNIE
jgi:hypothetical protein